MTDIDAEQRDHVIRKDNDKRVIQPTNEGFAIYIPRAVRARPVITWLCPEHYRLLS